MSFRLDLKGIKEVKEALAKRNKAVTDGVDKEMTATALLINRKQKMYTPVDTGRLRSGNLVDVSRPLNKTIENPVNYAAYMEFGTGGLVTVPAGLEDIAIQFKGKGIRRVNIAAQPFFFRAYFEERAKFIERIKNLIK